MKVIGERIIIERKTTTITATGVAMTDISKQCGYVLKSNLPDFKEGDLVYYSTGNPLGDNLYAVDKDNILAVGEEDD